MFHSARIKLTAWYLIIIMTVSVLFSLAIYSFLARELGRMEQAQKRRTENWDFNMKPGFAQGFARPIIDPKEFEEARNNILITLLMINAGILLFSGAAGYFLAGRTLKPIKKMVDEQNRFITDASHELRTPLTALKSETEVYLRGNKHTVNESNRILESNLEEVDNLQKLTDNLMQLAQYEKPNGNTAFTNIKLSEIIAQAQKKFQKAARQKSINIESNIQDCLIYTDREGLIQLIGIFIDNAIKYSPEKSTITITSKITDHKTLITISDQGIGIGKKDIPYIFDRFYRADSSRTKQKADGYGLGLSIAKKIADNMKGSIDVKSQSGKGTFFTIQLPILKK